MRPRISGSEANCTSFWMRRLPSSSAGCDLPAITNCTGRSACSRMFRSRCGSCSIKVSRLYVGTRRAKPIVRTLGSSRSLIHTGAIPPGFCSSQAAWRRWRASCTSCSRIRLRTDHRSPSLTAPELAQSACVVSSVPRRSSARARSIGSVQVGACTPLVTESIGTSCGSKPGYRPLNICRLTSPCSLDTPLACWPSRMPITAMLKTSGEPPG